MTGTLLSTIGIYYFKLLYIHIYGQYNDSSVKIMAHDLLHLQNNTQKYCGDINILKIWFCVALQQSVHL